MSSHSFRSISEVTFPCHQSSLPYPCPFSSVTLVTLPVSPIFLGVNFLIYKWPWTLPSSQLWSSNNLQLHLNLHNALALSQWSLASVQTSIASPSTQQLHEQMQSNIISYKKDACWWNYFKENNNNKNFKMLKDAEIFQQLHVCFGDSICLIASRNTC